ncbi:cystinosin homolog [Medicago truncatula]|uniref:Cystinosin homolog n=1 Tax=Medicago truncatula TaxID=3880 RepID=A0A072U8H0_MEDTR|nr:cystinosin homolog [Medicago truncatula]KEH25388.1 lysosomal cystine transporter family protein [Medicago truncatula]
MASWNSIKLRVTYEVLGWSAFVSWSISFYPQIILNFQRKSVVGLNFDYAVLNMVKQCYYLVYNTTLYFSPVVQRQYGNKYGHKQMNPVALNDVAFSSHAVLLSAITLYQIAIYERGNQKVSKAALGLAIFVLIISAICVFIALRNRHWLWLISIFNVVQVALTVIKYIPQAVFNFMRKSTEGWSIGLVLLDFFGGVANFLQMITQSIDQGSWKNIYGNIGKVLVAVISIMFDLLFMFQHYCLYRHKSETLVEPAKSQDQQLSENAASNAV